MQYFRTLHFQVTTCGNLLISSIYLSRWVHPLYTTLERVGISFGLPELYGREHFVRPKYDKYRVRGTRGEVVNHSHLEYLTRASQRSLRSGVEDASGRPDLRIFRLAFYLFETLATRIYSYQPSFFDKEIIGNQCEISMAGLLLVVHHLYAGPKHHAVKVKGIYVNRPRTVYLLNSPAIASISGSCRSRWRARCSISDTIRDAVNSSTVLRRADSLGSLKLKSSVRKKRSGGISYA